MVQLSRTADQTTIAYKQAQASVDFVEPVEPVSGLGQFEVRFRFAPGGQFDSFLHFHAQHAESLYCQQGSIRMTIGTTVSIVRPEDGVIKIAPWTVHRWEVLGTEAGETIVWESSQPGPERKEMFFRNIFSLFNDYNGPPPPLQMIKLFADYDNYPIGQSPFMHTYLSGTIRAVINGAGWLASLFGYSSAYKEYTPASLLAR